ncbi:energy transducer TonB [Sphingorhabdus sp. EL138]|uniref:energy transducer TonB n=1 Tax=Sphingorhabdus sp. EL138 TaxID=2073156 RepID=UPI0025D2971C|nr:energy transducer TonB [Sphingorhabdus sp. EL138]
MVSFSSVAHNVSPLTASRLAVIGQTALVISGFFGAELHAQSQVFFSNDAPNVSEYMSNKQIITDDDYPAYSRFKGHAGVTRVSLLVDKEGKPQQCSITETSGFNLIDSTTCEIYLARARYNIPSNLTEKVSFFKATGGVRWRITNNEQRPLLLGIKLVSESNYDTNYKLCKFSDNYGTLVAHNSSCTVNLVTESVKYYKDRKKNVWSNLSGNIADIYRAKSIAGDAESSLNLGLILVRYGYDDWFTYLKLSVEQGSAVAANFLCQLDTKGYNVTLDNVELLRYCKIAFDGGAYASSASKLAEFLASDNNQNILEKLTELRRYAFWSATARLQTGNLLYKVGSADDALAYLYLDARRGDEKSQKAMANIFRDRKSAYYNEAAAEIWSNISTVSVPYVPMEKKPSLLLSNGNSTTGSLSFTGINNSTSLLPSWSANAPTLTHSSIEDLKFCQNNLLNCKSGIPANITYKSDSILGSMQRSFKDAVIAKTFVAKPVKYPAIARRIGITGVTATVYRVNQEGRVDQCYIAVSTLVYSMDESACNSVREKSYDPASIDGQPALRFRTQNVRWSLTDPKPSNNSAIGAILGIIARVVL